MKWVIDDITVGEFFQLDDMSPYVIFMKTLKAENRLCGKSCLISKLTYNEVEVMKRIYSEPSWDDLRDLLILVFKIKGDMKQSAEEQLWNESVFQFFRANIFLQDFVEQVVEKEKKLLTGKKDEKWERVNAGERLKPVQQLLTKIRLAEQFGCSPSEIGGWRYTEVFTILVAQNRFGEVMQDYNLIR